jgi:4-hydroxyproline epimerase
MPTVRVLDSHTAGEPTRLVLSGGPDLGAGPLSARVERFRREFDRFRSAVVNEPRGSDALVGALLVEPHEPGCAFGLIFFNNVGYLGMCGHGTIGAVASLAHLGRLHPGRVRLDTPVGVVEAELHAGGDVSIENVPSYRHARDVTVSVPGTGEVRGDVAWGGNWFFLVERHGQSIEPARIDALTDYCWRVRGALAASGITGAGGAEIDHVELFAPTPAADSRSFVLCPGRAYDRSPCGTGTCAKIACLAAEGKLAEGAPWVQESVIGSRFTARFRRVGDAIVPTLTGRAHVTAEATLLLEEADPFRWGIRLEAAAR